MKNSISWSIKKFPISSAKKDTSFYRDYDVFSRFENTILPAFKETNRSSKKLRIWSVGCSTGQETYSIAMGIRHKFLGLGEWDIDIIGTDISGVAISKAQRGVYNNFEVQMGLNARSILEFFHLDGAFSRRNIRKKSLPD